jgi:uncharacterized protein
MNIIIFLSFLTIPFLASGSASSGPSFDCKKATSKVEKLICQHDNLKTLDLEIAALFKKVLGLVSSDQVKTIRNAQKSFLEKRNQCQTQHCLTKSLEDQLRALERQSKDRPKEISKNDNQQNLEEGIKMLTKKFGSLLEDVSLVPDVFTCQPDGVVSNYCSTYYQGCASTSEGGRCCSHIMIELIKKDQIYALKDVSILSLEDACKDM